MQSMERDGKMNNRTALANGRLQLQSSPTPALDARLLLQHLLGVSHSYLIGHDDEELTNEQAQAYADLLAQAAASTPIPYLIGTAPFIDIDLRVTPDVLIPRPETEQLVETAVKTAVKWGIDHGTRRIVDVGTGSGCIAISLARRLPHCTITAVDISPAPLTIAAENGAAFAPGQITFLQSDLLEKTNGRFDIIAANLPYVTQTEWTRLDDGVKLFEPALALVGGENGLELIEKLLQQAVTRLTLDGIILLEIGWKQGAAAIALARHIFPDAEIELLTDLAGHDRLVSIKNRTIQTELLTATEKNIKKTAVSLKNGRLISFPTDTVYGVGANPFDENGIARLYAAKERPLHKGIPILLASPDDAAQVAGKIPAIAHQLMAQHWPGALTIIVPRRPDLPDNLSPNNAIAIRVPDSATARTFIRAAGGAVAATSANRSGEPAAQTAVMAMAALDGRITAVLDNGELHNNKRPSTIIDCTQSPPRILRQGDVVILI